MKILHLNSASMYLLLRGAIIFRSRLDGSHRSPCRAFGSWATISIDIGVSHSSKIAVLGRRERLDSGHLVMALIFSGDHKVSINGSCPTPQPASLVMSLTIQPFSDRHRESSFWPVMNRRREGLLRAMCHI